MRLTILSGTANGALAGAMATALGTVVRDCDITQFPDGELGIGIRESVRGDDVFVVQPASPPVNEHLVELLMLADACRRNGTARVTAVMPYVAYARQDRRTGRSALGGRLMADLLAAAGIDRVVAADVHTPAIEGFFAPPVEHLSAVPLLAERVRPALPRDSVIVAPDLGAAKLAERYARVLDPPGNPRPERTDAVPRGALNKRYQIPGVTGIVNSLHLRIGEARYDDPPGTDCS